MSPIAELAIAVALPTAAGYAILGAIRGFRRLAEARRRPAPAEPIDRLAASLRRLRAELELTEARPGGTAKGHRLRALRGAYLDALTDACRRLDVTPPAGQPRQADIYRVEAALRQHGLDVRELTAP